MHSRCSAMAARISATAAGSVSGPCRNRQFRPSASADRVARHALEPLVDVDEGPIGQPGIGNRDALGRDVEGPVLQRELIRQSPFRKACGVAARAGHPPLRRSAAPGALQKRTCRPATA